MPGQRRSNRDIRKEAVKHAAEKHPPVRKAKKQGARGSAIKVGVQCGAKKRTGGKCTMAAGWGTNHPGTGKCKWHGGSMPNHVKAAAGAELRKLLGTEKEMNPFEAIMWCIRIRAGEVEWLGKEMAQLQNDAWVESTLVGKQFHLYARERQAAMQDLVRFSQIAISMGIAERYVRLSEVYGQTIAKLIEKVVHKLDPSKEQIARLPVAVREALLEVSSFDHDGEIIEGTAKELTAA